MGFCKVHSQGYMEHIKDCPICIGEKMKGIPARKEIESKIEPKKFRRKIIQIDASELNSDWIKKMK